MIMTPKLLRKLAGDRSGHSLVEFTLALPLLLTLGLWGTELANLQLAHMKIAEVAQHLADNASRIGDTSTLQNRKIYESDLNDLFIGASIQGGSKIDFFERGRAIISSLEVRSDDPDQQYIHWQRCKGKKAVSSSYGAVGDDVSGMGPTGNQIMAIEGQPAIFVEVVYDYQPIVSNVFAQNTVIRSIASFSVRDNRDLSQIYQRDTESPDTASSCTVFDGVTTPAI